MLPPSPILPDYMSSPFSDYIPLPLHEGADSAAPDSDAEEDPDRAELWGDSSDPQVPDAPLLTHVYHPKLKGKLMSFLVCTDLRLCLGQICDEDGNEIPPDTPPPSRDLDNGPND